MFEPGYESALQSQVDPGFSAESPSPGALHFDRQAIRRNARARLQGEGYTGLFLRQAWSESRLLVKKHVSFRKRANQAALEAYCAMEIGDFEGINARQKWANWRTIPKNLNGMLPNRPLSALDLCCGVGHSTEVLACYLPRGSRILGLEYNPQFVEKAEAKIYLNAAQTPCDVRFRAQSVLETFRDERDQPIADHSVDLVNSCGAVGSHFDPEATRVLAREVTRVLRRGGIATIDAGPPGTSKKKLIEIFEAEGYEMIRSARSCILEPFVQVCFRKL